MNEMEGGEECSRFRENGSVSGNGRPPNPPAGSYQQSFSSDSVSLSPCRKSLVRHPSLVSSLFNFIFLVFSPFFCCFAYSLLQYYIYCSWVV